MTSYTHYVIVRRDLPVGVLAAQITHAAGESFAAFVQIAGHESLGCLLPTVEEAQRGVQVPPSEPCRDSSEKEHRDSSPEVAGSSPALGSIQFDRTKAVVLGARSEPRLRTLERKLTEAGIPFVAIREPDAPWNGQLMAIGLHPLLDTAPARAILNDFHMLAKNVTVTYEDLA